MITIHFHGHFTEEEKDAIKEYLQPFPANFWRRNINIKKDSRTGLIHLNDGHRQHEIFKHECR